MITQKVYQVDYYGFVYIWRDSQKNKYYIGSHLGPTTSSYIGSNKWLKAAYKKRPTTFKRRIIGYVTESGPTRNDTKRRLHRLEQYWLNLINDNELATPENIKANTFKYYNMKKIASGGNGSANKGKPKKKPVWNLGITKEMIILNKEGHFCLLIDKPRLCNKAVKNKVPKINTEEKQCSVCQSSYVGRGRSLVCSHLCRKAILAERRPERERTAWNKNGSNPTGALNGKKGAEKQSRTVLGRRIKTENDGRRRWVYPGEQDYDLLVKKKDSDGPPDMLKKSIKTHNIRKKKTRQPARFALGSQQLKEHLKQKSVEKCKRGLDHKNAHIWRLLTPYGEIIDVVNLPKFCSEHGLSMSALQYNSVSKGHESIKKGKSKGWRVIEKKKG